jgi:N-methylhydantoinase B
MMNIDPIKFEVIRNALLEVTEEMAITMRRSAYSTNIKTRADFSCAFFDRNLRVVAQAFAQPNHLGSFVELVPRAVREYGLEHLRAGDAILTNDPYRGGVHLNDITLITPVFTSPPAPLPASERGERGEGQLLGFVASLAHHVDVGGGAPASIGAFREVFQEGIIIPPVKLAQGGQIIDDVFRLILAQIRSKHETGGDFRAQIAANNTGARRVNMLVGRMGYDEVNAYIDELIAYTERRTRADIAKLPRGEFTADCYLDNDGYTDQRVHLMAKVIMDDDGVTFDLSGCDSQRRAPVNSTFAQTFSGCAYVLKCLIDPDVPTNAGFYRCVRVLAPPGTVVNCVAPAPVVAGWETQVRLTDLLFKALAPALPERMIAGTKAMICHAGFGGISPRTGEYYCFLETISGGYGGRAHSDGPDAVQTHGQNTENAPIEETERGYPLRITQYQLLDDSEGAGKFRGGLGVRRDYVFPDHAPLFTILADRDREGPWGLFGGWSGERAYYILNPDGEAKLLSSKTTLELKPGDVISYQTCGGGGYGNPHERDPQLVLRDVREGKVNAQRAREVYGVAIDVERWVVDKTTTKRLREA